MKMGCFLLQTVTILSVTILSESKKSPTSITQVNSIKVVDNEPIVPKDVKDAFVFSTAFENKDAESKDFKCSTDASCGDCVVAEHCGYCRSRLTSGDGKSTVVAYDCRAGDQSGPFSLNQPCDSWSFISCAATCKNDCSGHGVCQDDSTCLCTLGFEGIDCSAEMPKHNDVEVLIPIAFICAFLAVVMLVYVQLSEQRCWNRGYTSDDEEESTNIEEPKFRSKTGDNRKGTLRSRPARG